MLKERITDRSSGSAFDNKRCRLSEIANLKEQPDPRDFFACIARIYDPILNMRDEWFEYEGNITLFDLDVLTQIVLFNKTYWVTTPLWSIERKLVKHGR